MSGVLFTRLVSTVLLGVVTLLQVKPYNVCVGKSVIAKWGFAAKEREQG